MHRHSRRGFFTRVIGSAGWASLSWMEQSALRAAQARAASTAKLPQLFDIEKLAEGIYGAVARPRAIINCNAVIFENAKGLMIVDAHSEPSAVASLTAQIRREIGPKPVTHVVTTHMHGDHTQGLPGYRTASPNALIIASEKTRQLMAELNPGRLKSAVNSAAQSVDRYEKQLGASKSDEEKAWLREMIAQTRAFVAEMKTVEVTLPDVTFERDMIIRDRAHTLQLSFRGRGHTAGDIVVYCPEKKVLASGDLCHSFFPTIGDGYPSDWPGTLRSMEELPFEQLMGGHGGPQHTRERMDQMRAYMEELLEFARAAKQKGQSLEDLRANTAPAASRTLIGGYGEFLAGEVKRRDFRVKMSTQEEILRRNFADNLTSVYRNLDRA